MVTACVLLTVSATPGGGLPMRSGVKAATSEPALTPGSTSRIGSRADSIERAIAETRFSMPSAQTMPSPTGRATLRRATARAAPMPAHMDSTSTPPA